MKRFKKIGLIYRPEQDNVIALKYAMDLAIRNQAVVDIAVIEENTLNQVIKDNILADVKKFFPDVNDIHYIDKHSVDDIETFVQDNSIQLLLLQPSMDKGLQHFYFGSITLSVLRFISCPVWVLKSTPNKHYQRVLIALDPFTEDQTLNDKLIQIGSSLAKSESAELHVACAWALPNESTLRSPFINTPEHEIEELNNEHKVAVAKAFEKIQARNRVHLKNYNTHLPNGNPIIAIPKLIQAENIDLLIIGTNARTGIKRMLIGNTVEGIINQVNCSLLVVKPDRKN
jgi:nucleotide-binding universal stress UspA family protein